MGSTSLIGRQLCALGVRVCVLIESGYENSPRPHRVLFYFSCLTCGAQDLPTVKDSEAAQYVGKNVEVRGLVVAVYTSKKGNTFLNFGGKYPNQTFTGYIPAGSELARDRWTVTLQGNVIGITGTVELYQGKPEIKVMSRSQIKGEDSQPVAQ